MYGHVLYVGSLAVAGKCFNSSLALCTNHSCRYQGEHALAHYESYEVCPTEFRICVTQFLETASFGTRDQPKVLPLVSLYQTPY